MNLRSLAGVVRAKFLVLPVTLVASGTAAAAWEGAFDAGRALAALVGLVALHAAVNAFNETSDYLRGIDLETEKTPFSGGSGTLPAGRLSPRVSLVVGVAGTAVGLGIGVWFLSLVGWSLVPIMILGALAVVAYTDVFARTYLGEPFAGLGLGALPVLGAAVVQTGRVDPVAVAAAIPAFLMTFNLLLLNEFPDEVPDRRGGRRNLIHLLGRRWAALVYALAALLTPVSLAVAVIAEILPPYCLAATLPTLLLVPALRWALGRPDEAVPLPALGANVVWNLATNTLVALSFAAALWLA